MYIDRQMYSRYIDTYIVRKIDRQIDRLIRSDKDMRNIIEQQTDIYSNIFEDMQIDGQTDSQKDNYGK